MKRLVLLGLAGIVGLGVVAATVVLLFTRLPGGAPRGPKPAPSPPASPVPPATPPGPAATGLPLPEARGLRSLQLPPGVVARDLTAALPPCHRGNPMGPGLPAVLTLELEAQAGGGLVVVNTRIASRGGASEGLVSCARQLLLGRRVAVGPYPPGERFVAPYDVVSPLQAPPPPPEPPATSLPVGRQQRRGGSR